MVRKIKQGNFVTLAEMAGMKGPDTADDNDDDDDDSRSLEALPEYDFQEITWSDNNKIKMVGHFW